MEGTMEFHLGNKIALITGAGSGIGSAIAYALHEEQCVVYLADRDLPAAERVASHLGASTTAVGMDVGNHSEVRSAVENIISREGRIDILVNSAGILKNGSILNATINDWEEVCRVNLSGVYYCSKAVLPSMVDRKAGKIINIASISAYKGGGLFGNTLYGTTKAGVIALTKGFARELAPHGINVNAIAPGPTDTGMTSRYLTSEVLGNIAQNIPCGRLASADEIAKVVVFLTSDLASYIAGETIVVDGGYLTK
jgi:3-oxoacyl-[acyl-carrier protein] reductase